MSEDLSQEKEIVAQAHQELQLKTGFKRKLFLVCGFISLMLGGVGVVLPLIPTTPFLLLACACFLRSSKRMYIWVVHNRVFGPYILNYNKRQMRKRDKISTIAILWIGMLISLYFIPILAVKVLLFAIACGVTWHLSSLETV